MSTTSQEHITTSHWESDWDIWRCLKCQGALQYDPFDSRPGLLAVRSPPADRKRYPGRQGPDQRQQPGRPAVLR